MSFKVTAISNPGTATKFGADDLDLHAKLLNGQVSGIPPVRIKSSNKFGFWDNILYIRNQGDTWNTTIRGQSNNPGVDVDLTLPSITANDTLAAVGFQNIFLAAQKMDAGTLYKDQTAPGTPPSGYGHVYYESGHIKKKNSLGVVMDYDNVTVGIPSQYDNESINIWNPAQTFTYTLKTSAITANRKAIFPILPADDTFAFLSLEQTFLAHQVISVTSTDALSIHRSSNTVGHEVALNFRLNDSLGNSTNYARVTGEIGTATDGSEDGRFKVHVRIDDVLTEIAEFNELGELVLGINGRLKLSESGLTSTRTITFPNATTKLVGVSESNEFTEIQTITRTGSGDVFRIRRDTSTVNDTWNLSFMAKDSLGSYTNYARIQGRIIDSTDGSEDGALDFLTRQNDSLDTMMRINQDGSVAFGSSSRRLKISDGGLTAERLMQFPNKASSIVGAGSKSGITTTISTTTAETDILNYSVGASEMGTNGIVRFKISGYLLQNQATGTTYTFAIKFGTTTMWQDVSPSIAQSATKLPFRIEGEIFNKNSASAQGLSGRIMINDTTAATIGIGDMSDDEILVNADFDSEGADTTKDTTSAQTLQVTVTMSVSNANTQTVIKNTLVEVIT